MQALIHVHKKLPLALDCRQSKYSESIIYIFFNFGHGFCSSFPVLLPKAPASSCKKKFELVFAALYCYIYELNKCLRFLKPHFKLEILIFLSFVVSF